MARAARARRAHGGGLGELRTWYVAGLRPKLTRAIDEGTVPPAAAAALDRDMQRLLDLPRVGAASAEHA